MLERAAMHPDRCRFCGLIEFWHLGDTTWDGVDVKTGEPAYGWRVTVRCVKCHATFNAEMRDVAPEDRE